MKSAVSNVRNIGETCSSEQIILLKTHPFTSSFIERMFCGLIPLS